MVGGATIVRLVVLQESRTRVSATAPPAPQNKLSRLLQIHRLTLEDRTDAEYAKRHETVSSFFEMFGNTPVTIEKRMARAFERMRLRTILLT